MDDKDYLQGRLRDLAGRTLRSDYLTHSAFLDPYGAAIFDHLLRSQGTGGDGKGSLEGVPCFLYGGFEEAERCCAVFLPSYLDREAFLEGEKEDPQVVACLEIRPLQDKFADDLTHRDFLGALMHLGIEREQVGDILTEDSRAFVFVMKDISPFIISELTRVRHTVVSVREIPLSDCSIRPVLEEKTGSVASERLDAVAAMAFKLSRTSAAKLIQGEKAAVDGRLVTDPDQRLIPGQKISLRGYGKCIYQGEVKRTKKDRLMVRVLLYR
jgi:RNA-binding protein YlmH